MRLTYAGLDQFLLDPDRQACAQTIGLQLVGYRAADAPRLVPDLAVKSIQPVIRDKMWFHGLGPMAYAIMLRRFKHVLEPMTHAKVETWRNKHWDEIVDDFSHYLEERGPDFNRRDEQDRVWSRHLRLATLFQAFYQPGGAAIELLAAGPPGYEVYGEPSNGVHRLLVAQALGTIATVPVWVSLLSDGPYEPEPYQEYDTEVAVVHCEPPPEFLGRSQRYRLRRSREGM